MDGFYMDAMAVAAGRVSRLCYHVASDDFYY